jgi:two-component system chemotaxis response regulator CheB
MSNIGATAAELGGLLAKLARELAGPPVPTPPEIGLEVEIALGRASDTPTLRKIGHPVDLKRAGML